MRIEFERTGGFAGMRVQGVFDSGTLPAETAAELERLVADADFFGLPAVLHSSSRGTDQFRFRVTVETAGRRHTVEIGDAAVSETLWPLLRRLTILARSHGRADA